MKTDRFKVKLIGIFLAFIGILVFGNSLNFAEGNEQIGNNNDMDIMAIAAESGQQFSEFYRPKAGIVIDSQSGNVLWSDNPDKVVPIASLSKLMTAYIVLEEVASGKITLEQLNKVSSDIEKIAQIYSLSNNKMIAGVEYSINELLTLMLIPSSNAATVMLSDIISPNDRGAFIQRMNATAKKIRDGKYSVL